MLMDILKRRARNAPKFVAGGSVISGESTMKHYA